MRLIDADKFLGFLIFSKHIDSLTCKEVKEAVEMCKVDVLDKIRAEIEREADYQDANVNADVAKGLYLALDIIDKVKERGI